MSPTLSPIARVLLWEYERGGLAYDLLCLALFLFLPLAPWAGVSDPMAVTR